MNDSWVHSKTNQGTSQQQCRCQLTPPCSIARDFVAGVCWGEKQCNNVALASLRCGQRSRSVPKFISSQVGNL